MLPDQYLWLLWSLILTGFWLILYIVLPAHRSIMWSSSLVGMLLGFSHPLFIPSYWAPPGLWGLALETGFDLESLIFCFAIAGISVSLMNWVYDGKILLPTTDPVRQPRINRRYRPAIAAPFIVFALSYNAWPWNPIYLAIFTMFSGAAVTLWCFPECTRKLFGVALLYTAIYAIPLYLLEWISPGYTVRVWNLQDLSGVLIFGAPLEEFLFAASYSLCCNSLYIGLLWERYGRQPA